MSTKLLWLLILNIDSDQVMPLIQVNAIINFYVVVSLFSYKVKQTSPVNYTGLVCFYRLYNYFLFRSVTPFGNILLAT